MFRLRILLILLVVAALGCAGSSRRASTAQPNRQNVLTREEIAQAGVSNMLEAITRLRPQFLRNRGPTNIAGGSHDRIVVYMDNMQIGGQDLLRTIAAAHVQRVEYISGSETGMKFGLNHMGGVIHIITK